MQISPCDTSYSEFVFTRPDSKDASHDFLPHTGRRLVQEGRWEEGGGGGTPT